MDENYSVNLYNQILKDLEDLYKDFYRSFSLDGENESLKNHPFKSLKITKENKSSKENKFKKDDFIKLALKRVFSLSDKLTELSKIDKDLYEYAYDFFVFSLIDIETSFVGRDAIIIENMDELPVRLKNMIESWKNGKISSVDILNSILKKNRA